MVYSRAVDFSSFSQTKRDLPSFGFGEIGQKMAKRIKNDAFLTFLCVVSNILCRFAQKLLEYGTFRFIQQE